MPPDRLPSPFISDDAPVESVAPSFNASASHVLTKEAEVTSSIYIAERLEEWDDAFEPVAAFGSLEDAQAWVDSQEIPHAHLVSTVPFAPAVGDDAGLGVVWRRRESGWERGENA